MARPMPMKFTLQGGMRVLRVERDKDGGWMIWLNANKDFSIGTFIQLCCDGAVQRITWHADGSESHFNLIGEDT